MDAIDRAVLAKIAGDVLNPDLTDEIVAAARKMYGSSTPTNRERLHRDLETVQREQARLTEAVAAGADVQVLVERLRATERRRQELTDAFNASKTGQAPAWDEIERRVRKNLGDWRSLITGGVAQARQGFRRLLTAPILFTPFVKNGWRGIRFEGRIGQDALFGGMVTSGTSPSGTVDDCTVEARGRIAA